MIDTHAHLNEIEEIDRAIQKAKDAGIRNIVAVGMDLASNGTTIHLAEKFPDMVYPAIGYHPWSISTDTIEENLKFIEENLPSCIALGEVGIDYKTKVKKPVQWEVFSKLLTSALRHNQPVIVHSRFSHKRSHQMVRDSGIEKGVFHWYSGPLSVLSEIHTEGYFTSATPAVEYGAEHTQAIRETPFENLMLETDTPVVYHRGTDLARPSEPADVATGVLQAVANLKGANPEIVAQKTTANAIEFFGLPDMILK